MAKVRQDRLRNVIRIMQEHGFDQLIVSSNASIRYLVGVSPMGGERLQVLVINTHGDVAFYTPAMNFGAIGTIEGAVMVPVKDGFDSMGDLANRLIPGKCGIEGTWPSMFMMQLIPLRGDVQFAIDPGCVPIARMVKDEEELELMRESSRRNDAVMAELMAGMSPDLTEAQFSQFGDALFVKHGRVGLGLPPMVCYGPNCADPHHLDFGNDKLKPGDFVLIDMGTGVEGYQSDMTRTECYGEPTQLQKDIYQIVLEANLAGIAAIKAGIKASEVDAAARGVIEKYGYGDKFIHRTGHGIGLEGHEMPGVGINCDEILQPGMCITVEPGIYLPGVTGVRIEDLLIVTENGCENLNHYTKELQCH